MIATLCLYLLSFATLVHNQVLPAQKESLYVCKIKDRSQLNLLRSLQQKSGIDVWGRRIVIGNVARVRVIDAIQKNELLSVFNASECTLKTDDLQQWIADKETVLTVASANFGTGFFDKYQSYDAIKSKLHEWSTAYPNLVFYNQSIGKSYEERNIPMIKITNLKATGPKKAIWWNAGQHARE